MLAGLGAQTALAVLDRQGAGLQARFAARRDNQAEAMRLREAAGRISDVEALLKDRRALTMVLEAFQLESEIGKVAMLRRVMTEDPGAQGSLVSRLADPRWRELAEAFATRRRVELSPEQFASQTAAQLRAMPLNRMAGLDFLQVQALNAEQVAALDPSQIAAIAPNALNGLDLEDVAALTRDQVAALTPAQLRAFNPMQVRAIEPDDIATLNEAQLRALAASQLSLLTDEQIRALRPEQVSAFTAAQAQAFTPGQLEAFGAGGRAILAVAPFLPEAEPAGAAARPPLADAALVERLVDRAMVNRFEKAMGESNPGLREALYFRRMAGGVTSIAQLMSDRALLEVARGALGLPKQFGMLSFEQQRDLITRRLDVAELKDPKAVARLAQRYLAQLQPAAPPASGVTALFDNSGGADLTNVLAGARLSLRA